MKLLSAKHACMHLCAPCPRYFLRPHTTGSRGVDVDFQVGPGCSQSGPPSFFSILFLFLILGMTAKTHVTRDETNVAWQLRDCQSCLFTEDPHGEISIAELFTTYSTLPGGS